MPAKSLKLEGYGTIMINPINIKEQALETVDPTGKPVEHKMVGDRAHSVYVTSDGVTLASNQICKKLEIEGEELIIPKFKPTKEISKDDITEIEDNGIMYRALDRKFYSVVTDSESLKYKLLNDNKSLSFPFVAAGGWKVWNAILTNWNKQIVMICCRGDLQKEMEKYTEQTVELEIETKHTKQMILAMMKN